MPRDRDPAAPVARAFLPTPIARLARLLIELFTSAADMRTFVRSYAGLDQVTAHLPGDNVPAMEMAHALAVLLDQHRLVTPEFFAELLRIRRHRATQIRQVAQAWEIGLDDRSPPGSPWSPTTRWTTAALLLAALCASVPVAAILIAGGQADPDAARPARTPPIEPTAAPLPAWDQQLRELLRSNLQARRSPIEIEIRGEWDVRACPEAGNVQYIHIDEHWLGSDRFKVDVRLPPDLRIPGRACRDLSFHVDRGPGGQVIVR